jgi:hypothetical protein
MFQILLQKKSKYTLCVVVIIIIIISSINTTTTTTSLPTLSWGTFLTHSGQTEVTLMVSIGFFFLLV